MFRPILLVRPAGIAKPASS